MGVILEDDFDDNPAFMDDDAPTECFYCGNSLFDSELNVGGVVFWHGYGSLICLHGACADQFAVHLLKDSRSLSSITGIVADIDGRRKTNDLWYMNQGKNKR